jgi:hypothetical protein
VSFVFDGVIISGVVPSYRKSGDQQAMKVSRDLVAYVLV